MGIAKWTPLFAKSCGANARTKRSALFYQDRMTFQCIRHVSRAVRLLCVHVNNQHVVAGTILFNANPAHAGELEQTH